MLVEGKKMGGESLSDRKCGLLDLASTWLRTKAGPENPEVLKVSCPMAQASTVNNLSVATLISSSQSPAPVTFQLIPNAKLYSLQIRQNSDNPTFPKYYIVSSQQRSRIVQKALGIKDGPTPLTYFIH